ncbi:MAG: peptidyl-prolyl cis-trans isomerase, partial [Gammaproteobacteria bacterium]|nr:peptidyl-prolyl cis-trans isomerase [Gammaproteobacteria bacterium]
GTAAPLPNVNSVDLANIFDQEFADRVLAADLGQWKGPFVSNRGQHWLRIVERSPASIPALEQIADLVRLEWIAAEEETRLQLEVDKLWDQYTIVISNNESD